MSESESVNIPSYSKSDNIEANAHKFKREVVLFGAQITALQKEPIKHDFPNNENLCELQLHKLKCEQLMEERYTLHLKCLEDPDCTSTIEGRVEKYKERLDKILDLCTKLINQCNLNSCNTKMIDKNEKILYLKKHQESPGEASSSSHDVQVEKDDMFSQGHRVKITAVPIKEYAYKIR